MKTKKVILTGFQPFGSYAYNPTEEAAEYFNGKEIDGITVLGIVLPASYYEPFHILSTIIDSEKPDAVISMGLSSKVKGIRIENISTNRMYGKYADANNAMPDNERILLNSATPHLKQRSNGRILKNLLLNASIPVESSVNADTFICNSLMYLTTDKIIKEKLNMKNAFIHVPWIQGYPAPKEQKEFILKKDQYHTGVELLIKNIVA